MLFRRTAVLLGIVFPVWVRGFARVLRGASGCRDLEFFARRDYWQLRTVCTAAAYVFFLGIAVFRRGFASSTARRTLALTDRQLADVHVFLYRRLASMTLERGGVLLSIAAPRGEGKSTMSEAYR